MSVGGLEPAQGPLASPAPVDRGPRRCESCGTLTGLLIFVPSAPGRGRRVCPRCLHAFDALRKKMVSDG
jgi:hypothetical protein